MRPTASRPLRGHYSAAATDLRQLALIFDWCQDLLTDAQSKALVAKLTRGIDATEKSTKIADIRNRTLAAAALADQRSRRRRQGDGADRAPLVGRERSCRR